MKEKVRTLDFYGFDDGCLCDNGSNFIKNQDVSGGTISKNSEHNVVNK